MTKLPRRADRITNPVNSAREAAWRAAVQPLDRVVIDVERRWGSVERLVRLATPELAARYASAWQKLEEAITAGDPELAAAKAGVVMRGLAALEAAATDGGHRPEVDGVWHVQYQGQSFVVCREVDDVRRCATQYPDARVWGVDELVRIAAATEAGVFADAAKAMWPGSTVSEPRPLATEGQLDDPLDDLEW